MKKYLVFLAIIFVCIFLLSGAASAATRYVGPGHTYKNISSAVSAASSGDVIKVYDNKGLPYTYKENVVINKKNLTITSYGKVTVKALNPYKPVFTVNGNYTTIKGFTVTGANKYNSDQYQHYVSYEHIPSNFLTYGILVNGYNCLINANKIINNLVGIKAGPYTTVKQNVVTSTTTSAWGTWFGMILGNHDLIQSNTINNTANAAILDTNVATWGSGYNRIYSNTISSTYDAIVLYKASHDAVKYNTINNAHGTSSPPAQYLNTGVYLDFSPYSVVSQNNIQHANFAGVLVGDQSDHTTVQSNTLRYNGYNQGGYGVQISGSSYSQILNNTIDHSAVGIELTGENIPYYARYNTILGNNLTYNQLSGIDSTYSFNNTIISNNFLKNQIGFFNEGSSTGNILNFNRIVGSIQYSIYNNFGSTLDARYNWWGSNLSPASSIINYGTIDYSPWLVLTVTPSVPTAQGIYVITADLLHDSNGGYHNPADGDVPDGIKVTYSTTKGTISSPKYTVNGAAKSYFTSSTTGIAYISATVDNQTRTVSVYINLPGA